MDTDFEKKLYNAIASEYNQRVNADRTIKILEKKITLGRATQKDVATLSERLGKHAGDSIIKVVPGAIPDKKMYVATANATIKPLMMNVHARVNTAAIIEQAFEDAAKGLKINLVKGGSDAVYPMIQSIISAKDFEAMVASEAITTAHKFYDDFQIANLDLRTEMGYTSYVTREYDDVGLHGKHETCHYCKDREGVYEYPGEANAVEVFLRHPGCGCTIEMTTEKGTMRQTKWYADRDEAGKKIKSTGNIWE